MSTNIITRDMLAPDDRVQNLETGSVGRVDKAADGRLLPIDDPEHIQVWIPTGNDGILGLPEEVQVVWRMQIVCWPARDAAFTNR